jgi:ribonuclease D
MSLGLSPCLMPQRRPLTDRMMAYARTDVRYLLYCASMLTAELIAMEAGGSADSPLRLAHRKSQSLTLNLFSPLSSQASDDVYGSRAEVATHAAQTRPLCEARNA